MKTLQINEYSGSPKKQWKLLQVFYKEFLKKDSLFHYFLEPELILRISDNQVLKNMETYLKLKNILYEIYLYPKTRLKRHYGDQKKKITLKYLEYFLKIYHDICVFYLETPSKDHKEIRGKMIHALFNEDFKSYLDEAIECGQRSISYGVIHGRYEYADSRV